MALRMIDLSQEIYQGMSTFPMHQPTFIMTNMTHEENMKKTGSKTLGFSARNLLISEHCGTHTDAIWEYEPSGPTIFGEVQSAWIYQMYRHQDILSRRTWSLQ